MYRTLGVLVLLCGLLALVGTSINALAASPQQHGPCHAITKAGGVTYITCSGLKATTPYFLTTGRACPNATVSEWDGLLIVRKGNGWPLASNASGLLYFSVASCGHSMFYLKAPGSPPVPIWP